MLPTITSPIVIEGRDSTISRNTRSDLTFVNVGASGDLTLNETVVTGALAGGESGGQGIRNSGRLALNDSSLTHLYHNGLANSGVAVIRDSSITGNLGAYGVGCGIHNSNGGTIRVTNSVISGNGAFYSGVGIYNAESSSATLTDSIVSHNSMHYGYEYPGGGIFNRGSLTLVGSTVSTQGCYRWRRHLQFQHRYRYVDRAARFRIIAHITSTSYTRGGGIDNRGKLTLINSTVSNNAF